MTPQQKMIPGSSAGHVHNVLEYNVLIFAHSFIPECDFNANKMKDDSGCTSGTTHHKACYGWVYVLAFLRFCLINL